MSAAEATRWLEWLYGPEPDGLLWIGGHGDRFAGRTFTSISDAVAYGMELDAGAAGGVYHRLTTLRDIDRGRGAAVDSAYLPGFAMDLDLRGPGHKALNYPETEQELITLLRKAGLPEPSVWVHSGGGRYPFWKLEQPADLTLPGALEEAAGASAALHRLVIEWAADAGWKVDNTSDLARVYRLPGTMNRKGDQEVMAHVRWGESDISSRYNLTEINTAISRAARPAGRAAERLTSPTAPTGPFALPSGTYAGSNERAFTVAEAMQYVQPALDALREARDGEINNRLNDAALQMAHFGEDFWPREAAIRQLMNALEQTEYDGATWTAETTIASAFNAMATKVGPDYWRAARRADLIEAVAAAPPDAVEALLAEMVTLEQIKEAPPKRYLIKGYLNLDSESWMIGAPGSRKSFVALDMACHVAGGKSWQGARVTPGKVVIIAAEGAGGLGARVKAWEVEHGPLPAGVIVLPRPVQVADVAAWAVLVKACERIDPVMVVIDTQARVTAGLDENSSQLSVFVDAVTAVRRATGACVLAIHHTSKAGQDARGHSVIDGAQDTELKVVACAEPLTGELRTDKQKDLAELPALKLRFKVHTVGVDEDGEPVSSLALAAPGPWDDAEVGAERPEEWETGHAVAIVQLFKVLRDQGGTAGLTKAEARQAIVERFYGGQPKALAKSTYYTAWDRAMAKVSVTGDQVMTNVGGQRWTVDEQALKALAAPGNVDQ